MREKVVRWFVWIIILGAILIGISVFSLCVGSVGISVKKIILLLLEGRGTAEYSILFDIRMPRILLGFAVGGALSIAGVILQGMFRNPLVEPYTLGISGGASLGVCLNIVLRLPSKKDAPTSEKPRQNIFITVNVLINFPFAFYICEEDLELPPHIDL